MGDDLTSTTTDQRQSEFLVRLAGMHGSEVPPLAPRLLHLAGWLSRLLNDPVLAWWAGGYESLHPRLLSMIEWRLDASAQELSSLGHRVWRLLVEQNLQSPQHAYENRWHSFLQRHKKHGWSPQLLRDFERILQPRLTSARPLSRRSARPSSEWDNLRLAEVVKFDVEFIKRYQPDNLNIPTEILPTIVTILRRGLEKAASLLEDTGTAFWRTETFIPDSVPGSRISMRSTNIFSGL